MTEPATDGPPAAAHPAAAEKSATAGTLAEPERLRELARRLSELDPEWTGAGLRRTVSELGWEWAEPEAGGDPDWGTPAGPVLRTGLPGGAPARLRPVARSEEPFAGSRDHVGLYIPLPGAPASRAEREKASPAEHARAFWEAGRELTEAFGAASVMGVYGMPMPYYDSPPLWGSPFLRWRGDDNSLELHPTDAGPELLLLPTEPQEDWHWRQGHGEDHALGGFFATRRHTSNAGLGIPGGWRADDWGTFESALGDFLHTLAAETTALGIRISVAVHGRIGSSSPMLFNISCAETLELGHYHWTTEALGDAPGAEAMRELGWIPADEHRATHDHFDPVDFTLGTFAPGEADGRALAHALVGYLRQVGVPSPRELSLSDSAQELGDYWVDYYGLTLKEDD